MSQTMKAKVLAFLQNLPESKHDQFNAAYELYKQSEGKNLGTERNLNRIGFTETGLQNMLYDLQQMHHITDLEIAEGLISEAVEASPEKTEIVLADLTKAELQKYAEGNELTFDKKMTKAQMIESIELQMAAKLADIEVVDEVDANAETHAPNFEKFAHDVVDEDLKPVREEFPFLNAADCPDVFYIVVGKKITAYKHWQEAQQTLAAIQTGDKTATEDEVKELAVIAETNFRENQALYNELNHYATTGEILGKHSLFRESVAKKEVDAMTMADLSKYRNSSAKYFTDKKKLLTKHADNAEKVAEINQQIEDRKYKLSLVDAKLGINEAGK